MAHDRLDSLDKIAGGLRLVRGNAPAADTLIAPGHPYVTFSPFPALSAF
jgi:hypothetical protein